MLGEFVMEYIELGIGVVIALAAVFGNRHLVRSNIFSALKPLEDDTREIKEVAENNSAILQRHDKIITKYLSEGALYREIEVELNEALGYFSDDIRGASFLRIFTRQLKEFYASISVMWGEELNLNEQAKVFVKIIENLGIDLFGEEHFSRCYAKLNYFTKKYIVEIESLEKSILNNRKNRLNSLTLSYYYKITQTVVSNRLKAQGEEKGRKYFKFIDKNSQ